MCVGVCRCGCLYLVCGGVDMCTCLCMRVCIGVLMRTWYVEVRTCVYVCVCV